MAAGLVATLCAVKATIKIELVMRVIFYFGLLLISFVIGCEESVSTTENNQIVFRTASNSYSTTDSITVSIENNTNLNFEIALRCGKYLEMYYQKDENNTWSKNLWFSWMSLKCLSKLDTIKIYSNFQFIIPSNEITVSGTYRLILANNTSIVSNSFEVK